MQPRERIRALGTVEARVGDALLQIKRIRCLTNWHRLGGNTRASFESLRSELVGAVATLD